MRKNFWLIAVLLLLPFALYGCSGVPWWLIDPPGGPTSAESLSEIIPNRFIVLFAEPYPSPVEIETIIAKAGGTPVKAYPFGVAVAESEDPEFVEALKSDPAVEAVVNDIKVQWVPEKPEVRLEPEGGLPEPEPEQLVPGLPAAWAYQWDKRIIEADLAWAVTTGDPRVEIAIIDTGIDYAVLDLQGKVDFAKSTRIETYDVIPPGEPGWLDLHFHGTWVAGIAAASGRYRVIGVCPDCTLIAVKVLTSEGWGYWSWVMDGIYYAATIGADIANMSLGPAVPIPLSEPDVYSLVTAMSRAINWADLMGTLVIDSNGNANLNGDVNKDKFITNSQFARYKVPVSATDLNDHKADYSNYGQVITYVAAPGGEFYLQPTFPYGGVVGPCCRAWCDKYLGPHPVYGVGGWIITATGTSAAAPQVSGVAGLIDSLVWGAYDAVTLRTKLACAVDDLGAAGFDLIYGHGRVNANVGVTVCP